MSFHAKGTDQNESTPMTDSREPVGLIAGWGRYPVILAKHLAQQGRAVYCLAIRDHADPTLAEYAQEIVWLGLGQLGRAIRLLRRWNVREATLVGKIHKVTLFRPWMVFHHWPDWCGFRTFAPHFFHHSRDNRDDTLLMTVCRAFETAGIRIRPATDYLPEILVPVGPVTPQEPTQRQWADICFGWRVAKEMGRLDIGQTVVVKDQVVLAVEAIEGTDACLRRAGELCPVGGFTVVKVAKPQQDMRFDVPTIGLQTLQNIAAGKGSLLAIEAEKTIFLDPDAVLDVALKHGITIVAVNEDDIIARTTKVKAA